MPRMPRIPQSDGVGRGSSDNQVLQAPAACQYRRCVGYCLLTLAALAALVVATGMSAPILSALHAATGPNAGAPLMMPPTSLDGPPDSIHVPPIEPQQLRVGETVEAIDSVSVHCATSPASDPLTHRWCRLHANTPPQGSDVHLVVSLTVAASGGSVTIVHPQCAKLVPTGGVVADETAVDGYLRNRWGPDLLEVRVRGPEYRYVVLQQQEQEQQGSDEACTYKGSFKVALPGQYLIDAILVYTRFEAVNEHAKGYPFVINTFVFSNVAVTLEASSSLIPPPDAAHCNISESGRWVKVARSYEARSGWLPPKYESPDVREMNCDDTVMDVNDYQWQPDGCVMLPLDRARVPSCVAGKKILFYGDSQLRNAFFVTAQALGVDVGPQKDLAKHAGCYSREHPDVTVCHHWDAGLDASTLVQQLILFDAVFFNPGIQHKAAGSDFYTLNEYHRFVRSRLQLVADAGQALPPGTLDKLTMVAAFPYSRRARKWPIYYKDHRTSVRLFEFQNLALAEWLRLGFTGWHQYLKQSWDAALPFSECTIDHAHYSPPVVEALLRPLMHLLCLRFGRLGEAVYDNNE